MENFNDYKDFYEFMRCKYYAQDNGEEEGNIFMFFQENSVLKPENFQYFLDKLQVFSRGIRRFIGFLGRIPAFFLRDSREQRVFRL